MHGTRIDYKLKSICIILLLHNYNRLIASFLHRRYVWRCYHLVFQGEKLEDDKMRLKEWVYIDRQITNLHFDSVITVKFFHVIMFVATGSGTKMK